MKAGNGTELRMTSPVTQDSRAFGTTRLVPNSRTPKNAPDNRYRGLGRDEIAVETYSVMRC
jgi:hypothetical protein